MLKKGFHGFCMALAVLILSSLFESHSYVVSSLFIGFIAGSTLLLILGAYLPVITAIKGLLSLKLIRDKKEKRKEDTHGIKNTGLDTSAS